jgi:UDP-N-acetylmuramate--alanine ligase
MNILEYNSFYLVGIKGVALTALAQCLVDAGKKVSGSDVAEEFVTQKILDRLKIKVDHGFEKKIPKQVECVIYTAAHQSNQNPQVVQAAGQKIPTLSHAEALASLFNQKKGIAVCGVGGKSTTSAMIAWIFAKATQELKTPPQSFAVGVGNIPGLDKTGQWNSDPQSYYFVAEADEYVTDPSAPTRGEEITPRFSFLKPFVTVCTNLRFDHPDVYKDFEHTKQVYAQFFGQISGNGALIINADDTALVELAQQVMAEQKDPEQAPHLYSFGMTEMASLQMTAFESSEGKTISTITDHSKTYQLTLAIPGKFNAMNALAAVAVCNGLGIPLEDAMNCLLDFHSTMRRSEFIGKKNGVTYYDDYAHHPNEIQQVIQAFKEWYPQQKVIVAFQSHTYSRTKALFNEFADAFADADEVVMADIFSSAREEKDESISSDLLCAEIKKRFPQLEAKNLKTNEALAEYCKTELHEGDILLTLGAGDIYKVHDLI